MLTNKIMPKVYSHGRSFWHWCIDLIASVIHSQTAWTQQMDEYHIEFTDGEVQYILAENLEEAAWSAIDLAYNLDKSVKDIIPTYVKQQILSKQMETGQELA